MVILFFSFFHSNADTESARYFILPVQNIKIYTGEKSCANKNAGKYFVYFFVLQKIE